MDSMPNNGHDRQPLQVLATVTHDLRNLLSVILGYGELLYDQLQVRDYEEAVSILEHVRSGARHAHALVVNYGDILRMADHTLTLHMQPVEINRILRRAIALYEIDARCRGVTLTTCFGNDLPPLKGDPVALERVFTNLIHNALKFTPAGGVVTLKSAQYDGTLIATITDTGCGIAPTVIPLLFDTSQRPENGAPHNGMGLGLVIVKTFVDAHGGRVVVDSAPGQGTSFSVYLPLASGCQAQM